MKCCLNCLILSYLLSHLMLAAVMAVPEVAPFQNGLKAQHNSDLTAMKVEKRAAPRQYNFGIGKRLELNQIHETSEDLSDDSMDENMDDLDKRGAQNRFQFGLGKRIKPDQRFSFGLGKRAASKDNRFNFGLGKRQYDFEDYIKRRYSFGLGKRTPTDALYMSDSSEKS